MKIVDAVWEKRNLGISSIEATIEATDTLEDITRHLPGLDAQYIVVKVPTTRPDVMFNLSEMGYTFIEGIIHITKDVRDLVLTSIQKRLADGVTYSMMNESDMQVLWKEIRKGMFDTDRVFLDPHFTDEQAANRYIKWISDEMERGTDLYKLIYKEEAIGFFTMKELGKGVYYPFLAGMYEAHRNSGLGFNIAYKPICEILERGGKSISTYISTNNDKAVRIHVNLGFSFDQTVYVYVKHNKLKH